jgi:hypothetical protein
MMPRTRLLVSPALASLLLVASGGCEEPRHVKGSGANTAPAPAPPKDEIKTRETLRKWTQEVRNLKPELAQGGQLTDGKIHATDYITLQADAYRTSVGEMAKMKVKMDMDQYEALNGEKPKTYEEFMDVIIKKGKPDGIMLPMLPYYQEYGYDPDKKELVVIEYPEKKKAYQEQQDRALGRK